MEVEVLDSNDFGVHDFMGKCKVSIMEWIANGKFEGDLDLEDKAGNSVGRITVSCSFKGSQAAGAGAVVNGKTTNDDDDDDFGSGDSLFGGGEMGEETTKKQAQLGDDNESSQIDLLVDQIRLKIEGNLGSGELSARRIKEVLDCLVLYCMVLVL